MITFHTDWREAEREVKRLSREPSAATQKKMAAVLAKGFTAAQALVHIQTGSLKSSGKMSTSVSKARAVWEGELSWGGPSTGVNNPVDYALYEQARDGDHDFTLPLGRLDPAFLAAMRSGL